MCQGLRHNGMLASILWFIAIATVLVIPPLLLWGWIRWMKSASPLTVATTLSLIGFSFATASALLVLFAHLFARFVRSFPAHDPTLMKLYSSGCLLSSLGIVFGVGGTARRGPVRWLAPACAFGTLLFWLLAMSSE
jgi:hypothetical protein